MCRSGTTSAEKNTTTSGASSKSVANDWTTNVTTSDIETTKNATWTTVTSSYNHTVEGDAPFLPTTDRNYTMVNNGSGNGTSTPTTDVCL